MNRKPKRSNPQQKKNKTPSPTLELEKELLSSGSYDAVIGIDEVGRGSYAGPVIVSAFVYTKSTLFLSGVKDSKFLNRNKRNELKQKLRSEKYYLKEGSVEDINAVGIGAVITKSIEMLLTEVSHEYPRAYFLIDGQFSARFAANYRTVIKGDQLHYSISCASIIAKCYRDDLMIDLADSYPNYFFEKNMGYGTEQHREAIRKHGICPLHRTSFKPLAVYGETKQPR